MNINFNIYADRRAKGPRATLMIQFNWTENGRQVKRSVSTRIKILKEDYNWKKNTIEPVTHEGEEIRDRVNAIRGFMIHLDESIPDWFIQKSKLFARSSLKKEKRHRLVDIIDRHLEMNQGVYSYSTVKRFKTLRANIEGYINTASPDIMSLMDHNEQASWFSGFVKFLVGKQYKNQSIVQEFKLLSSLQRFSTDSGIRVKPSMFVSGLRVVKGKKVHLYLDEVRKLIERGSERTFEEDVFLILCLTGLRPSELVALPENGYMHTSDKNVILNYTSEKTGTKSTVPLHATAVQALRLNWSRLGSIDMARVMRKIKSSQFMIDTIGGEYVNTYFIGADMRVDRMPRIEALTAHSGRHTFSHLLTEAGVPIDEVARVIGHSSADTTREWYNHSSSMKHVEDALGNI